VEGLDIQVEEGKYLAMPLGHLGRGSKTWLGVGHKWVDFVSLSERTERDTVDSTTC